MDWTLILGWLVPLGGSAVGGTWLYFKQKPTDTAQRNNLMVLSAEKLARLLQDDNDALREQIRENERVSSGRIQALETTVADLRKQVASLNATRAEHA